MLHPTAERVEVTEEARYFLPVYVRTPIDTVIEKGKDEEQMERRSSQRLKAREA